MYELVVAFVMTPRQYPPSSCLISNLLNSALVCQSMFIASRTQEGANTNVKTHKQNRFGQNRHERRASIELKRLTNGMCCKASRRHVVCNSKQAVESVNSRDSIRFIVCLTDALNGMIFFFFCLSVYVCVCCQIKLEYT